MTTDSAIQQVIETLFDPNRITWNLSRPDPGTEPAPQEIFIGVGTRDATLPGHPLMLSWKLPQWRSGGLRSCTEAVMHSAEALDALALPLTLRVHEPTLDIVSAALLLVHRVIHHRWPAAAPSLMEYVSDWEQGRTERAGDYETALASVFYAWLNMDRGELKELVKLIGGALGERVQFGALPAELIPARVSRRLKADADLYRAELSRGWKLQLDVPLDDKPTSAYRRLDALFLSSPQDVTVLKLLARPDTEASLYRRGFELMAVHAPNEPHAHSRHTITLAPESAGTLADLGVLLDQTEGPDAPDGTPRTKNRPRFSFQPAALEGMADPWYSDGYAWSKGRSTLVAPPFAGTRLSREEIWETVWQRFNLGRNVHVTQARTIYAKPFRVRRAPSPDVLTRLGFRPHPLDTARQGFLPSVVGSFHGDSRGADVAHWAKGEVRLSVYPSNLALVWVEHQQGATTLFALCQRQSEHATGGKLDRLAPVQELAEHFLDPMGVDRWLVYGAYRINRARSSMLDESRCVLGLFHCLASGAAPTLSNLPSDAAIQARTVHRNHDVEHWFTASGGARLSLDLEDSSQAPALDEDFALFLLTLGQRYAAFEITRRMGELERGSRTSWWEALRPRGDVRKDVMLFTNSLWHARVSDDPQLDARYQTWRELHRMPQTVEALRSQTQELDEYRKERFESMVGLLVFVFLPITIVCGFFSGAQFSDLELKVGLPWTTGGWKIFLIYTALFTVVVFGTLVLGRLLTWRRR